MGTYCLSLQGRSKKQREAGGKLNTEVMLTPQHLASSELHIITVLRTSDPIYLTVCNLTGKLLNHILYNLDSLIRCVTNIPIFVVINEFVLLTC